MRCWSSSAVDVWDDGVSCYGTHGEVEDAATVCSGEDPVDVMSDCVPVYAESVGDSSVIPGSVDKVKNSDSSTCEGCVLGEDGT